jgi:DNA-binding IscR family transcriptional regulator
LARPPAQIKVSEILHALEGEDGQKDDQDDCHPEGYGPGHF